VAGPEDAPTVLRMNPRLDKELSPNYPTATMLHELLHAIRSDNHNGSSHSSYTITIDGVKQEHCFNYAALEIYRAILRNGMLDEIYT
jgi:hypothetical protein